MFEKIYNKLKDLGAKSLPLELREWFGGEFVEIPATELVSLLPEDGLRSTKAFASGYGFIAGMRAVGSNIEIKVIEKWGPLVHEYSLTSEDPKVSKVLYSLTERLMRDLMLENVIKEEEQALNQARLAKVDSLISDFDIF